jgi:ATP-binding cassette subfamily C protein CydD
MGVATLVATAATVTLMLVAAHVIAAAFGPSVHSQLTPLIMLLGLIGIRAAGIAVTEAAAARMATAVKSGLRLQVIASVMAQGRRWSRDRTGELVTTAIDGVEKLDAFYRRFVPQLIATPLVPVLIVAVVVFIDPLSALLLALTAPLIPLFMWLVGAMAQQRTREQWTALSVLGGRFLDTLQGLSTLVMFNRASEAATHLSEASEELRERTMRVLRVAFLSGFVLELAASLSTAIVAVSIGVRLIEGWMTFERGLAVLLLTPEFYLPFRQLGQRHHAGMEGLAAAERIFHVIDASEAAAPPMPLAPSPTIRPEAGAVSLIGVSFTYPDGDALALNGVTLTMAPRTLTAITGESGAGKTTLLALLLRLMEPTGGRMLLDGRDSVAVTSTEWRQHLAFVPQQPHFIHGSILDNLRMGRPTAPLADVVAAARLAHLAPFIESLPQTYDTVIDERATTLSGGERQRLALARALVKRAPVLLLDEPTCHLDTHTAALIVGTIDRLRQHHTVIVVTHQADLACIADHIVHLEDGMVVTDRLREQVA